MRTFRLVLWAFVVILAASSVGVWVGKTFLTPEQNDVASGLAGAFARSYYAEAGGPFTLTNTAGETVTEQDYRGKPLAMFFGFTHCPDVCPTALFDASNWLKALGDDAEKLQVVFVSVDPERDRPDILGRYVGAFDKRIDGLTADTDEQIREITNRYKVQYQRVPLSNGDYTVNHTADTLLFDKDGEFAGFIPYMAPNLRQNETAAANERERAMQQLRNLVAS